MRPRDAWDVEILSPRVPVPLPRRERCSQLKVSRNCLGSEPPPSERAPRKFYTRRTSITGTESPWLLHRRGKVSVAAAAEESPREFENYYAGSPINITTHWTLRMRRRCAATIAVNVVRNVMGIIRRAYISLERLSERPDLSRSARESREEKFPNHTFTHTCASFV